MLPLFLKAVVNSSGLAGKVNYKESKMYGVLKLTKASLVKAGMRDKNVCFCSWFESILPFRSTHPFWTLPTACSDSFWQNIFHCFERQHWACARLN